MRSITTLLLALLCVCCLSFAFAEEDEELDLFELLEVEEVVLEDDGSETLVSSYVEKPVYEADGSVLITISATGDFTIGKDSRKRADIFGDELKKHDGDVNFTMQNMRDVFLADDLTIVNFEGTLTNSTYVPANKRENQFLFSAPPEWASVLPGNGIEAAALENNHIMDHGEDAYVDTQQALENAGIVWSNSTHVGVIEVKGVQIAMLSYLCIDRYDKLWDKVPADIRAAKEQYPIVIVSFHWGNEKDYSPTNNQIRMGRLAADSGADLVLGHHSHRLNPIEDYNGVYICYSLGNFCFAGHNKPDDMTSYVLQTRFRVRDGVVSREGFRIIPIRISSRTDRNDFIPTPLTKTTSIDSMLTTLKNNGRKLNYAVTEYPLSFE